MESFLLSSSSVGGFEPLGFGGLLGGGVCGRLAGKGGRERSVSPVFFQDVRRGSSPARDPRPPMTSLPADRYTRLIDLRKKTEIIHFLKTQKQSKVHLLGQY